jgi:hypothetical protein
MVPSRIVADVMAATGSGGGSPDPTGLIGLVLALVALYLTLRPPRNLLVIRLLSAGCLGAAAWFILEFFSVSVWIRIVVCAVLLVAYLGWTFGVRARVSKAHKSELKRILGAADEAITKRTAVSLDAQQSSVLSCHFRSVGDDIARWSELIGKEENVRRKLGDKVGEDLDHIIDDSFEREALLDGMLAITTGRALARRLDVRLPPMLGTPDAIFRIFPGPVPDSGLVAFAEGSGAAGVVCKFPPGTVPSQHLEDHARTVFDPVYSLIQQIQTWNDAVALPYAHTAAEGCSIDLQKKIRAARKRKWIRRVQKCPVCRQEAAAQA